MPGDPDPNPKTLSGALALLERNLGSPVETCEALRVALRAALVREAALEADLLGLIDKNERLLTELASANAEAQEVEKISTHLDAAREPTMDDARAAHDTWVAGYRAEGGDLGCMPWESHDETMQRAWLHVVRALRRGR